MRRETLSEKASKELLKPYNIPFVKEKTAVDAQEAMDMAGAMGFPVVVKGFGKNLLHKTEQGLVYLHLTDAASVRKAAIEIRDKAKEDLEGYLIQPQIIGQREFVAGLFRNELFGPVIMFGLGGILAEALSDVVFRIAPLTPADAGDMLDEVKAKVLLDNFRGEAAVNRRALTDILMALSKIGVECPEINEIDLNPLLITPRGEPVAVDALVVKGNEAKQPDFLPPTDPRAVRELFYPKSVAFVGASGQIGKWGYTLLTNTLGGGYKGEVYLVNSKGGTIAGRKVYKSVGEIPGSVDVAVVTIPADAVPGLIPQLKAKGVGNMLLIASGFAETGQTGREKEQRLIAQARQAGIHLIGPNTMGICNPHIQFYCMGSHVRLRPGATSVVAQSGNMGNQLLAFAELQGIGIRGFCGSGNEGMITIEDLLDAFEIDTLTQTVMLYVESVKNGRRFYESARRVSRKKPIVLLKGGQSHAGNKAASSHTGALSSDTRVFNAVCRQAGIVKVEKPMDLLDLSAAFSSLPLPKGPRVAIMTLGGGWGVVAADLCEAYGLAVPELTSNIIDNLDEILPDYWSRSNPVDLVGESDMSIPMTAMEQLMAWDGCDAVINLGIVGRRHMAGKLAVSVQKADPTCPEGFMESILKALDQFEEKYIEHLVNLMEKYNKPTLGVSMLREEKDRTVYDVEGRQFKGLFFPTPEQAVKSLAKMYQYHCFLEREERR